MKKKYPTWDNSLLYRPYGPAHAILVSNLFNFHPFVSSRARGLNLGLSLYFVNACGEASGESEPPMLENAISAKITYAVLNCDNDGMLALEQRK